MAFPPNSAGEAAAALTAERVNKWEAVAALIVGRGKTELPVAKVAAVLRSVHDLGISHRKIGLEHNVHHGRVDALKAASLEVAAVTADGAGERRGPLMPGAALRWRTGGAWPASHWSALAGGPMTAGDRLVMVFGRRMRHRQVI